MGSAGREVALSKFSEGVFVDNFLRLYQRLTLQERTVDGG
jgi:hypothetical protein